ncbi:MAG: DUF4838 domain-containing protein [Acutalibacteraceae bacterium]
MYNNIFEIIKKTAALFSVLYLIIGNSVNPVIPPFVPEDYIVVPEEAETMTLIENGASDYVIVCSKTQGDSEYTAALKLQHYLEEISGVRLPIVSDLDTVRDKEIIVGKTNREGEEFVLDRSDFHNEDVNVFTLGKKIIIAGAERRGTLYGVYAFLEKALGCRWYAHDLIYLPESSCVKVPLNLGITEKPLLEYRETDWISPKDIEYSLANRLNGNTYRPLSDENGGFMGYVGGFCHTFTTSICPASEYFDAHPEYFALHENKRTPNQLCLTNPEVLDIVIAQVRTILQNDPDAIVSLTQHDNQDYCECASCKAIDDYEGSHAGTMLTFVNKVADAIKDDFPDAAIDTFAYQYTRTPPKHIRPRDNVIVRLCSIECCFAHALSDPDCEQNIQFYEDLKKWSEISNRLYVWDYTTNYAHFAGPFPNFHVIQANMQLFVENNVVGVYEEGNYTASNSDAEFAEYRAYLLSRLLWDPYCDLQKESDGFLREYYGDAWQYIREYIRITCAKTGLNGKHMTIYRSMSDRSVLTLTKNEIKYIDELWATAKSLAENEVIYENVERSELSWRYWKGCNKAEEFSRTENFLGWKDENSRLYEDFKRLGITQLREGRLMKDNVTDFTGTPDDWR